MLLDPARAAERNETMGWRFAPSGEQVAMHMRHGIAAIADGQAADLTIELELPTWAKLLAAKLTLSDALASGVVKAEGNPERILSWFGCFDHPTLGR